MSDLVRTQSINRIIEDLRFLSPADFENVGHNVICGIENTEEFRHPGVNKDNIPVKGAVDTISQTGFIIGEYSTEEKYFETSEKSLHDLQHALESQPQVRKLYLLSNREMPPAFYESFKEEELYKHHRDSL